jgi:protein TonB
MPKPSQQSLWLLALLMAPALAAAQATPQKLLDDAFVGKTLTLRHFYSDTKLEYDATGAAIGDPKTASWTLAGLTVQKCRLAPGGFILEGLRSVMVYDNFAQEFYQRPPRHADHIEVAVEELKTELDASTIQRLRQALFYSSFDELKPDLPDYWKAFFRLSPDAGQGSHRGDLAQAPVKNETIGNGVTAPVITSQSGPQYSKEASKSGFQGVSVVRFTVDESGRPRDIAISRPLGFGLDDEAVLCVKKWRFKPAKNHGRPVSAAISVEVSFRL